VPPPHTEFAVVDPTRKPVESKYSIRGIPYVVSNPEPVMVAVEGGLSRSIDDGLAERATFEFVT